MLPSTIDCLSSKQLYSYYSHRRDKRFVNSSWVFSFSLHMIKRINIRLTTRIPSSAMSFGLLRSEKSADNEEGAAEFLREVGARAPIIFLRYAGLNACRKF